MRGVVQPRLRGRILARDRPFRGRRGVLFVPRMGLLVVLREVFGDRALDGGSQGRAAGVVADAGQRGQREGASSVGRFDGRGGASPDRWGRRGGGGLRGRVRFAAGVGGKDGGSARGVGRRGFGKSRWSVRVEACAYLLVEASSRCFLPLRTPKMYPTTTPSTHVATATRGTEPRCSGDPSNGLSPRVGRARARGRLGSTDAVAFATNAGPLGPADTTSAAVIAPECTRLARAGSAEKRQTAPADSESCCESAPRHSRRFASTPRKRNRKRSVVAKTGHNTSRDGCRAPGAADGGRARR